MAEVDHKPLCGSLVLVSGPSRSGKSRWAEHLVRGDPYVTYVATLPSRPDDVSWQERIDQHRRRRPEHWCLLEADQNLTSALSSIERKHSVLLDAVGGLWPPAWINQRVHGSTPLTRSFTNSRQCLKPVCWWLRRRVGGRACHGCGRPVP